MVSSPPSPTSTKQPLKRSFSQGDNSLDDDDPSPALSHSDDMVASPRASSNGTPIPEKPVKTFEPGVTPIKFYDEEVNRMHAELEKQRQKESRLTRRAPRRAARSGITLKGFLARVAAIYLLFAVFLVCPSDSNRDRAICRKLDSVHSHIRAYEPTVRPYYLRARTKAAPYISKLTTRTQPYVDQVRPHYVKADQVVRPWVIKSGKVYQGQVYPRLVKALAAIQEAAKPVGESLKKQYDLTLAPSVEWYTKEGMKWYRANLEPHVAVAKGQALTHYQTAYDTISPVYVKGVPLAQKHLHSTVLPFTRRTYARSRRTYIKQIHPRAVVAGRHIGAFWEARILPSLQRFYSLYIAPQVDKITERIYEYRTKKEQTEAIDKIAKEEARLAKEAEVDDLDDFIAELRDSKYTAEDEPAPDAPAAPAPAADSTDVPMTPEERKEYMAKKRATLEALSTTYEKEIARLGGVEQELLVQRLIKIRSKADADIPKRFGATITSLDEEGDKMIGKLGKFFSRAAVSTSASEQEKVDDAEFLAVKALAKVRKMAAAAKEEVAEYRATLAEKESNAVARATAALNVVVSKAQEELAFGWTWLDDVRHSDWQRFHQIGKAESNWLEYYVGVQTGAIKDKALSQYNPAKALDDVEAEVDDIVTSFEKVLTSIKVKGQKEIKGEWTGIASEGQKIVDAASEKLVGAVEAVKASASSLAGVTPTPTDLQGTASSYASIASESAVSAISSAYNAVPTIPPVPTDLIVDSFASATDNAASAVNDAVSAVDSAVQSAVVAVPEALANVISMASSLGEVVAVGAAETASLVGATVSPLAAPHPSFISDPPLKFKLSSVLSDRKASVESLFGDASQAAVRAVGQEPSPTDLRQTATSLANVASTAVVSASEQLSSYANDPVSTVSSAAAHATAAVSSKVVEAASAIAEGAGNVVDEVKSVVNKVAAHVEL